MRLLPSNTVFDRLFPTFKSINNLATMDFFEWKPAPVKSPIKTKQSNQPKISAYELLRIDRMKRNEEILQSLNLSQPQPAATTIAKRKSVGRPRKSLDPNIIPKIVNCVGPVIKDDTTKFEPQVSQEKRISLVNERKRIIDLSFNTFFKKLLSTTKNDEEEEDSDNQESSPPRRRKEFDPLHYKSAGSVVALVSTGQCGIIMEDEIPGKGRRKLSVKLDDEDEIQYLENSQLFWLKSWNSAAHARDQIYDHIRWIPQMGDLTFGTRVVLVKHRYNANKNYETGVIEDVPEEGSKQTCFHVRMEVTKQVVKTVAEVMRVVVDKTPRIGPDFDWNEFDLDEYILQPASKSTEEWARAIKPPKSLGLAE